METLTQSKIIMAENETIMAVMLNLQYAPLNDQEEINVKFETGKQEFVEETILASEARNDYMYVRSV